MNSKLINMKFVSLTLVFLKLSFVSVTEIKAMNFVNIKSMEKLIDMQARLIDFFLPELEFIRGTRQNRIVTKFVKSLEQEHSLAMKNVTRYLSNPINAYRLVKRLLLDLQFAELVSKITYIDFEYGNEPLLSFESFKSYSALINNLINNYKLSVEDISNGTLKVPKRLFYPETKSDDFFIDNVTPLASTDCYFLVSPAVADKSYDTAQRWLNEARRKFYDECNRDCPVTMMDYIQLQENLIAESTLIYQR